MNAKIDISNVVIKTERLLLRPWRKSDLDDFYHYARVDGVGQMAGWLPHENKKVSKKILEQFIEEKFVLAITLNGIAIGSVGIDPYNEQEFPELNSLEGREIGYVLSMDYWGNGYTPEAVKAVINYCFNELNLDFLLGSYAKDNYQSKRVQEKCGFTFYKEFEFLTSWGEVKDSIKTIIRNSKK